MIPVVLALHLILASALACGVEGTVMTTEGNLASAKVNSSVDDKLVSVKKGHYNLEFDDGVCGTPVTIYFNKAPSGIEVLLPKLGNVQVNIVLPTR